MSDTAGAAPAVGATEAPALPEGMLSMPKVSSISKKKLDQYDLENEVDDTPIKKVKDYDSDDEPAKHIKKETKKPQAEAVDDDEESDDEENNEDVEDSDSEEEETNKPKRKKRALELTNEDVDEDEDAETAEEEETKTTPSEAEDPSKVDADSLNKKYKISVKDGDKTVEKEYSLKQLFDMAQKNESGDLKLYQAAELYKKSESVIERLKNEPFEIMQYVAEQTKQDYYNMIEGEMARLFQLKTMTPEQRDAYVAAEQDKKDLMRFRKEQADLKQKLEHEELSKQQQKIANDFVTNVGDIIATDPYLKHVYDNLDEGDDKNYIVRKFGSFIQNGLIMKQIPQGQPNHLPANFDLSPKNPIIIGLVTEEIKKEAETHLKNAAKAQKLIKTETPEEVVKSAGSTNRPKIPGVKQTPGKPNKPTSKEKKAKKQSTYDFLRTLVD